MSHFVFRFHCCIYADFTENFHSLWDRGSQKEKIFFSQLLDFCEREETPEYHGEQPRLRSATGEIKLRTTHTHMRTHVSRPRHGLGLCMLQCVRGNTRATRMCPPSLLPMLNCSYTSYGFELICALGSAPKKLTERLHTRPKCFMKSCASIHTVLKGGPS